MHKPSFLDTLSMELVPGPPFPDEEEVTLGKGDHLRLTPFLLRTDLPTT